jgi:Na+/H+ antiporter NhaC
MSTRRLRLVATYYPKCKNFHLFKYYFKRISLASIIFLLFFISRRLVSWHNHRNRSACFGIICSRQIHSSKLDEFSSLQIQKNKQPIKRLPVIAVIFLIYQNQIIVLLFDFFPIILLRFTFLITSSPTQL